jgi:hypothetical protein
MTSEQSTETNVAALLAAADEALVEAGFRTGCFEEADRLVGAALDRAEVEEDQDGRGRSVERAGPHPALPQYHEAHGW